MAFPLLNVPLISTIWLFIYQIGVVYGSGPLCLECQREAVPSSCNRVVQCGPHEKCLLRQFENERGMILYQSGCVDSMLCANFAANSTVLRRTTKRELTLCYECCGDDYCNSGGCNAPGFSAMKGYPPVCFICQDVNSPQTCGHIERCGDGEMCYINKISLGHFQMGCKTSKNCQSMNSHNDCSACCSDDFCNKHCNTTSSGQQQSHTEKPPPSRKYVTIIPGTTIQPLLRCFHCPESTDPHCNFHQICPQDNVCYSSIQRRQNSHPTYTFQCKHRTNCPHNSTYTDWVVLGRRKRSSSDGYCCFSDDCNFLPPTVTQLHTTPLTITSPIITDVGPLLKNTTLGVNVGFHCSATGFPKPTLHWDVPLPLPVPPNYVQPSSGDLIIWRVAKENAGYFTCVASNEYGTDSQTITLTVS
ncbi:uncharacterized protein LOC132554446 [Ylistrum balloti]|uniref:uncharacterized protein LOC132554446 n=1 Tax=Ylistrum balloti TaxID=509963 RepID=UPI002905B3F8|nr:uncharacterized protein LOC132554446 [Ylistrum balloti]